MKTRRLLPRYELESTEPFDARRGYTRCPLPGVGASYQGEPGAIADFWRDRSGNLVLRLSSRGYVYHYQARLAAGGPVPDSELDYFGELLAEALARWIVEGVDDAPELSF